MIYNFYKNNNWLLNKEISSLSNWSHLVSRERSSQLWVDNISTTAYFLHSMNVYLLTWIAACTRSPYCFKYIVSVCGPYTVDAPSYLCIWKLTIQWLLCIMHSKKKWIWDTKRIVRSSFFWRFYALLISSFIKKTTCMRNFASGKLLNSR